MAAGKIQQQVHRARAREPEPETSSIANSSQVTAKETEGDSDSQQPPHAGKKKELRKNLAKFLKLVYLPRHRVNRKLSYHFEFVNLIFVNAKRNYDLRERI